MKDLLLSEITEEMQKQAKEIASLRSELDELRGGTGAAELRAKLEEYYAGQTLTGMGHLPLLKKAYFPYLHEKLDWTHFDEKGIVYGWPERISLIVVGTQDGGLIIVDSHLNLRSNADVAALVKKNAFYQQVTGASPTPFATPSTNKGNLLGNTKSKAVVFATRLSQELQETIQRSGITVVLHTHQPKKE